MSLKIHDLRMFCQAYLAIRKARYLFERTGLKESQRLLLRHWKVNCRDIAKNDPLVREVERAVTAACLWQIQETLCFPRAAAAYSLLQSAGAKPVFYVGIRAQPFEAHAWVETNGVAVADTMIARERQCLQVMFSYPDNNSITDESQLQKIALPG